MKIKLDKIDKVFSRLVRGRANWCCEKCGTHYPEGNRQGLHCSHLFGRARKSTRWSDLNAVAHCFGCHRYLTANPFEFTEWSKGYLGEEQFNKLTRLANTPTRLNEAIKREIYEDLKAQLKTMEDARAGGETGYLPFEGFNG